MADVYLALRHRDFNPFLVERIPQPEKNLALDIGHPINRVLDPEAEKHVDGAVAEARHVTDRSWRRQHTIGSACNRYGKIAHRVQITAVGHAELHIEPHLGLEYDQLITSLVMRFSFGIRYSLASRPRTDA